MATKPAFKLLDGHTVKHAFTLDGVKYYEFADTNMMPCGRMFSAIDYYEEFKMRCTREYLTAHCQAVREQLDGKKGTIDFMNVAQLYLQLQERLEFLYYTNPAYKYASVIYFDESESPYEYNMKYNQDVKIPLWKKHQPEDFFLSKPVSKLFPLLNISANDFRDYLTTLNKVDRKHLETIFTTLSKDNSTKDWYNRLELLKREVSA